MKKAENDFSLPKIEDTGLWGTSGINFSSEQGLRSISTREQNFNSGLAVVITHDKVTEKQTEKDLVVKKLKRDVTQVNNYLSTFTSQFFSESESEIFSVDTQQVLIEHYDSLAAFAQFASPFWLPVVVGCRESDTISWVTAALPSARFDTYLISSAANSFSNRFRLMRDVVIGLYQRRALDATHNLILMR